MAGTIKRTQPGDAANIFVRCMLSDISDLLGGCSKDDLEKTVKYFDYKCPYTGQDISVEYKTGKWVLDHLISHNRESCGLNLYGNYIVTTKETNAKKATKSFEDFIRFGTNGSDEEKEKRIQKIRDFQEQSGYFKKVKNIDEIKELCKSEYDFIQKRLCEKIDVYKKILEITNNAFTVNQSVFATPKNFVSSVVSSVKKSPQNKIIKSEAINLFRQNGLDMYGNITFASQNANSSNYWANPPVHYLQQDWWLILNDIDEHTIHAFFIPANSISADKIVVRADKPNVIDLQINYDDINFKTAEVEFISTNG